MLGYCHVHRPCHSLLEPPVPTISTEVLGESSVNVTLSLQHLEASKYVISGYKVTYNSTDGQDSGKETETTEDSYHTFNIGGLVQGTEYTFEGSTLSAEVPSEVATETNRTSKLNSFTFTHVIHVTTFKLSIEIVVLALAIT